MFYVYLLVSQKDNRTYVGSTDNVLRRLAEHNSGKSASTKHRIPFKFVYQEQYDTEAKARKREKYLKSRSGRRGLKKIFEELS